VSRSHSGRLGTNAMFSIAGAIESLADCFTESSNDPGNLTSPQRHSAAINLLEEDGDLTCTPRLIHNGDIIHIMNTNEIV
jgi:hypothetical protein